MLNVGFYPQVILLLFSQLRVLSILLLVHQDPTTLAEWWFMMLIVMVILQLYSHREASRQVYFGHEYRLSGICFY